MSNSAEADAASTAQSLSSRERQLAGLRPWQKGQSGNAAGRPPAPVDIAALARVHGPRCIEVAAELLEDPDPRIRLATFIALLDRGFGKPVQAVKAADDATSFTFQHLIAARAVLVEINAERAIEGRVVVSETNGGPASTPNASTPPRNLWEPADE